MWSISNIQAINATLRSHIMNNNSYNANYRSSTIPQSSTGLAGLEWLSVIGLNEETNLEEPSTWSTAQPLIEMDFINSTEINADRPDAEQIERAMELIKDKCMHSPFRRNIAQQNSRKKVIHIINTKAGAYKTLVDAAAIMTADEVGFGTNAELLERVNSVPLVCNAYHKVTLFRYRASIGYNMPSDVKYLLITTGIHDALFRKTYALIANDYKDEGLLPEPLHPIIEQLLTDNEAAYYTTLTSFIKPFYDAYKANEVKRMNELVSTYVTQAHTRVEDTLNNAAESGMRNLSNTLASRRIDLENCWRRLAEFEKAIRDAEAQLLQAKHTTPESLKDMMDILKYHPGLLFISKSDDYIYLIIKTSLMYFNEEEYTILRDAPRYNQIKPMGTEIVNVLDRIFLNKELKLNIISGVCFNLLPRNSDSVLSYINPNDYVDAKICQLGIWNPHHKEYHCFGDYKSLCYRAITEQRYADLIMHLLTAVASVNLADGAVFERFIRYFKNGDILWDRPCIEVTETKELLTMRQAVARYGGIPIE